MSHRLVYGALCCGALTALRGGCGLGTAGIVAGTSGGGSTGNSPSTLTSLSVEDTKVPDAMIRFSLADPEGVEDASLWLTARLWDVADTAPWLHDGRATTLSEAILLHGGEGQASRDAFAALQDTEKEQILAFLRTLRAPKEVDRDLRPRR